MSGFFGIDTAAGRRLATIGTIVVGLILVWVLREPLVPLLIATAIAFLLNPLAERLEKTGHSRLWAAWAALAGLVLLATLVVFLLVPAIVSEMKDLANRLPTYQELWASQVAPRLQPFLASHPDFAKELPARAEEFLREHAAGLATSVLATVRHTLGSVLGLLLSVIDLLIVPVLVLYLVADGPQMGAGLLSLLPPASRPVVDSILVEISDVLRQFVYGQLIVCGALAVMYGGGLLALGIPFAIPIALFSGLANFVPYLGIAIGMSISLVLTALEYRLDWRLLAVPIVFGVAQSIEAFVITPRVIGEKVGLHPVLVLVAILVFGKLFGFAGLLLALPATAVLNVLFRRAKKAWTESETYLHGAAEAEPAGE